MCPFGIFSELSVVQIDANDTDCSVFEADDALDDECNFAKDQYFKEKFSPCYGKSSCQVEFPVTFPKGTFKGDKCMAARSPNRLFVSAICAG